MWPSHDSTAQRPDYFLRFLIVTIDLICVATGQDQLYPL